MPINQLISFSHNSRAKNGKCQTCTFNCSNDCNRCLEEIHYANPNGRIYDCSNMIYCYSCSYLYKYASEIHHLFNLNPLTTFTEFNILSLGCGSCADLFGINNFLVQNDRDIPLRYLGIDNNEKWNDTHNEIIKIFPNYTISFIETDVFNYIDSLENANNNVPNILIIQYLINELIKYNLARLPNFIGNIVAYIIDKMPDNSVIIFNDYNHNTTRYWFAQTYASASISNVVSFLSYRFLKPKSHSYGGITHRNDGLLFTVPQTISNNYDVKEPCSAAQAMIYKTKSR